MKVRFLLALSLLANAYLGFVFSRHGNPGPESAVNPSVARVTSPIRIVTHEISKRFDWQSVETDDYTTYIANLRAIGCPEETIQDIVIADVCKMFEEKKREARKAARRIEYWRTNSRLLGSLQLEYAELDHKLSHPIDAERNALLQSLGIDLTKHNLPVAIFDAGDYLLDFLSDEKRDQLRALKARFVQEIETIRVNASPEELQEAFRMTQRDADRRIKELLTTEEALQYDLRYSHTADMLRKSLDGFEPTEQEFVQLFEIRRAYEAKLGEGNVPVEREQAAKETMNDEIRAALGETRYADYDRTDDYGFQQLWSAAQKAGLSADVAKAAFQIRRTAMHEAQQLREANINAAKRDAALQTIREETEIALKTTLGSKGWQTYGDRLNLEWLERIWRREQ